MLYMCVDRLLLIQSLSGFSDAEHKTLQNILIRNMHTCYTYVQTYFVLLIQNFDLLYGSSDSKRFCGCGFWSFVRKLSDRFCHKFKRISNYSGFSEPINISSIQSRILQLYIWQLISVKQCDYKQRLAVQVTSLSLTVHLYFGPACPPMCVIISDPKRNPHVVNVRSSQLCTFVL